MKRSPVEERPHSSRIIMTLALGVGAILLLLGTGASAVGSDEEQDEDPPPRIIAWNDLGMHCIDPDFSLFSILPPFNSINSHVILNGRLHTGGNLTVTYEGIADPTGSINTTSIGKTNFWDHEDDLFGVDLPLDVGLTGSAMPGAGNLPQPMHYDPTWGWYQGEGIPVTPFDDALNKNPYPLMKVTVKDGAGQELATTVTSVPNSQELECSLCHGSGGSPDAIPGAGWAFHPDPLKDDRLNILRLHDELEGNNPTFQNALATLGFNPAGLYATAVNDSTAVLCDSCHGSNALPGTGLPGISPMTQAIHGRHADARNPSGVRLDDNMTRGSCYTCHPGFDTQCLRGAMGRAIAPSGGFQMDCQSCHGGMADVASPTRVGWLDQATCQNCHTGTAIQNSGAIRFASIFDANGNPHVAADDIFATTPDVPAQGFSLYRFSSGHGGLQCAACHGPPHAIYPTGFDNDNAQSIALQGHEGTITDCAVCHGKLEDDEYLGPHGMHPVSQKWAEDSHGDAVERSGLAHCQKCHGADSRGTVLSRAQGDRFYTTRFGAKNFWRGFEVGCWSCHDGPDGENPTGNRAPVVPDRNLTTPADQPGVLTLTGTDADSDPLGFRVVSQPEHGTVGWNGAVVTYRAEEGYEGSDFFTYAARDGLTDSNLGRVDVTVAAPECGGLIEAYGFGCPGTGDELPGLSLSGCPEPGGTVTLEIDGGLGGANAFILAGGDRATLMLAGGCALRVAPILQIVGPIALSGGGAGAGEASFISTLSPSAPSGMATLQVFIRDPAAATGWSASNGVEVFVP